MHSRYIGSKVHTKKEGDVIFATKTGMCTSAVRVLSQNQTSHDETELEHGAVRYVPDRMYCTTYLSSSSECMYVYSH